MPDHLPAVEACPLLSLKAVYSRSKKSADSLAKLVEDHIDAYFDAPLATGYSLDDLLAREDIHAVVIALPIPVQPATIRRAIAAGKHVLSEKPISPDVKTAVDLLTWYKTKKRREIWSVGENFRFMNQLNLGADIIRKLNANVVTFSVRLYGFMDDQDEFYESEWYGCLLFTPLGHVNLADLSFRRRNPKYPGGPLLDCGIHYVAALRFLLSAAGQSITHIAALASQLQPHLNPRDTIHSVMQITNQNNGTFSLSFGAEYKREFEVQVVTDKGTVTVTPTAVTLLHRGSNGEMNSKDRPFKPMNSHAIRSEIVAFAEAINTGKMDARAAPEEALADLKVLQAMLESAENRNTVKVVK